MDLSGSSCLILLQNIRGKIQEGLSTEVNFDSVSTLLSGHLTFSLWRIKIREELPKCVKYCVSKDLCKQHEHLWKLNNYQEASKKRHCWYYSARFFSARTEETFFTEFVKGTLLAWPLLLIIFSWTAAHASPGDLEKTRRRARFHIWHRYAQQFQ